LWNELRVYPAQETRALLKVNICTCKAIPRIAPTPANVRFPAQTKTGLPKEARSQKSQPRPAMKLCEFELTAFNLALTTVEVELGASVCDV